MGSLFLGWVLYNGGCGSARASCGTDLTAGSAYLMNQMFIGYFSITANEIMSVIMCDRRVFRVRITFVQLLR